MEASQGSTLTAFFQTDHDQLSVLMMGGHIFGCSPQCRLVMTGKAMQ